MTLGSFLRFSLWYLLPLALWMAFIFFLSSKPAADYSQFRGTFDFVPFRQEIIHGALYFVLTWLILRAVNATMAPAVGKASYIRPGAAVAAAVLYGFTDEWHQSFVPGRNPSLVGIIADGLGASCAAAVWLAWASLRARRS